MRRRRLFLPSLTSTLPLLAALFTGCSYILIGASSAAAAASPAKPRRAQVDASGTVRVTYGNSAWNTHPTESDSASILMREGTNGRLVQIHLDEEAPNSGVFSGLYSIHWENLEKFEIEFYVPPQDQLSSVEGMKKVASEISSGQLRRKPFLLRRGQGSNQTIEIYDSVEQAQLAMRAYVSSQEVSAAKASPGDVPQGLTNTAAQEVNVAKIAERNEERDAATEAMNERQRLSQIEAERLRDQQSKYTQLDTTKKEANSSEAAQLVTEANQSIASAKADEAPARLEKAVELDPQNKSYLYQLGGALYRTGEYNRAIVVLQLAAGDGINETERQYYLGLSYFAIKDYDNAEAAFDRVISAHDTVMGPSSQFYKGVIRFERKQWDLSQAAFQAVLDQSSDAALDRQADIYIEQILRIRQFEAEGLRKFQLGLTVGEMVDSNILLSATTALDQGQATNSLGYRSVLMGSFRYRPIYEPERELAAQVDLLTIYTRDKSFSQSTALRDFDPTVVTLSIPYTVKSTAFGLGYKFDIAPGYEGIVMAPENDSTRLIVDSAIVTANGLLIMNPSWFANWNLEARKDNSHLDGSVGVNDSNAYRVRLYNTNTLLLDQKKTKYLTIEGGLAMNMAIGSDATYNRIDLGFGYFQPFYGSTVANVKANYFNLSYPIHSVGRIDDNYMISAGATKKLSDRYTAGLLASYDVNNSTLDVDSYSKWTVLATLSALTQW